MFQHFGNRLKRDLKQLVDRRLDASVVASGSLQKVSTSWLLQSRLTDEYSKSSGVEVDVISHKRQRLVSNPFQVVPLISFTRYAVWFGGSLLASLVSCDSSGGGSSSDLFHVARILYLLLYESPVRRDWAQYLQTLPDFW